MFHRFLALRTAHVAARAAGHGLTFSAMDSRTTDGADRRQHRRQRIRNSSFRQYTDHFRDHIAGTPDHHRIANANILTQEFIQIVERGVGDRDAADKDRFQPSDRG